jgi:hypothetical protein
MNDWSRRKHRRFSFRYRVTVSFRENGRDLQLEGFTKDVSAGGLLLECATRLPKDSCVSLTIVAEGKAVVHPIEFTGEGRVMRVELDAASSLYAIALKCARPLQFHPFEPKDNSEMRKVLMTS